MDEPKTRAKYDERLDRIDSILNGINEALDKDWQDIYDAFRVLDYKETKFINMPGGKLDIDPDLREAIKNANDGVKIAVEQMRKDFVLDPEDIKQEDLAKL